MSGNIPQTKLEVKDELQMLNKKVYSIDKFQIELFNTFVQKTLQLESKIVKIADKNYFLARRVDILEDQNRELKKMVEQLFNERDKTKKNHENLISNDNQSLKVQCQVQLKTVENYFKEVHETAQDISTENIVNSCLSQANKKRQDMLVKQISSTRKQTFIEQNQIMTKKLEKNTQQHFQNKQQQGNSQQFQQQSSSEQEEGIFSNFIYEQAEKFVNNNKKVQKIKENIELKYNEFQQVKQTTEKSKLKLEQVDVKINQLEAQQKQILTKYQKDIQIMQSYQEKLKQKIIALKINGSINCSNQKIKTQIPKNNEQQNLNISELIAHYAQSMFWLMNSYFLSFRIMKTQMFRQDKSIWQSQTSQILKNVKKVITLFTKVQIIKTGVQIVSYLIGIYLEEEQQMFNQKIYQFITEKFFNEKDINEAISQAIILLIEQKYISEALKKDQEKFELQKQNKGKVIINKAKQWYQVKKAKILQNISGLKQEIRQNSKYRLDIIVMDDLAKVFAFIAINKISQMKVNKKRQKIQQSILSKIFYQALINDKMNEYLVEKYNKQKKQQDQKDNKKKLDQNQKQKCHIY